MREVPKSHEMPNILTQRGELLLKTLIIIKPFLWDIGKRCTPRPYAAKRSVL